MHGDVWEWCQNRFEQRDVIGGDTIVNGDFRVFCGGAFLMNSRDAQSGHRITLRPDDGKVLYGFRLARTYPCARSARRDFPRFLSIPHNSARF